MSEGTREMEKSREENNGSLCFDMSGKDQAEKYSGISPRFSLHKLNILGVNIYKLFLQADASNNTVIK